MFEINELLEKEQQLEQRFDELDATATKQDELDEVVEKMIKIQRKIYKLLKTEVKRREFIYGI